MKKQFKSSRHTFSAYPGLASALHSSKSDGWAQDRINDHIHRLAKSTLDLLKQEIFAVLAVATLGLAVVLVYNYQISLPAGERATAPSTGGLLVPSGLLPYFTDSALGTGTALPSTALMIKDSLIATTDLGNALWDDDTTIYFGSTIKGYNRYGIETWQTETGVRNQGSHIQVIKDNQVTIAGVTNGNHTLWVKGKGNLTIGGISFVFKTLNTLKKVVEVTNNNLVIKLKAGAQIYTISTLSLDTDIPATSETDENMIPAKILMIPNKSTVTLSNKGIAIFKPIVIVTDSTGKRISNVAGMLSWSSSNPEIAKVGTTGIVTATKIGGTAITTKVAGTDLSATIYLTVKSIELSPLVDVTPRQASVSPTSAEPVSTLTPTPAKPTETNPIWQFFISLFSRGTD